MRPRALGIENGFNFLNSKFCPVKGKYNRGRLNLKVVATIVMLLMDTVV